MMVNGPPIFRIGDAQALSQDSTDGEGFAAVTRPRFSLQLRERIVSWHSGSYAHWIARFSLQVRCGLLKS
jgi:hypothetical protein